MNRHLVRSATVLALFVSLMSLGKIHAKFRGSYDLTSSGKLVWLILFVALVALTGYAFGIPERPSLRTPLQTAIIAAFIPPLVVAVGQTMIGQFLLPRMVLSLSVITNAAVFWIAVKFSSFAATTDARKARVLLLCDDDELATIRSDVAIHTEIPCVIFGNFDPRHINHDVDVLEQIRNCDPTIVVYSVDQTAHALVSPVLRRLHAEGIRVRTTDDFYDAYLGKVPIRNLEETSLLFDVRELHHPSYHRISRLFDISVGVLGLIALTIAAPFVLIGNMLGNRGPLLYSQERIGRGGTVFRMHKFRTMEPSDGPTTWTTTADPRITPFGRMLRSTHIDEIPQVINILRGDLSVVGPRPEQPRYVDQLRTTIPFYDCRHLVSPGLTGWAQVNYPYGSDEVDAFEKLQFEFWYLRHQRLVLDVKIMARTIRHVLGFKGR